VVREKEFSMPAEPPHPEFHRIYLDTNVLLRGQGWPVPSIVLNNLLRLAELCSIERFLPEPVVKEAEEHWLREVKDGASKLSNAKRELHKSASPIQCDITLEHPPVEKLLKEYQGMVGDAVRKYRITRIPFTARTVEEVFGFATKYLLPFAHRAEGKGFQDAVILLSVLDHLNSSPEANAIFVTADGDFAGIRFDSFMPSFDPKRLRVLDLEMTFDFLSRHYYEESVIKPYEQEKRNALVAAEALTSQIEGFVESRITVDMMKPGGLGGTVTKLLSLEGVTILSVDTPLPEPNTPRRSVEILIAVMAVYKVIAAGGIRPKGELNSLSALLKADTFEFIPFSENHETYAFWRGRIQATAEIVNSEFKKIALIGLVPENTSLPEPPASLKARGSAEFWMTRKIEEEIIGKTNIPAGELPDQDQVTQAGMPKDHA